MGEYVSGVVLLWGGFFPLQGRGEGQRDLRLVCEDLTPRFSFSRPLRKLTTPTFLRMKSTATLKKIILQLALMSTWPSPMCRQDSKAGAAMTARIAMAPRR